MENQNVALEEFNEEINIEEQRVISTNMFITLSIVSFGIYTLWWMYKSWRFFKQKEDLDISPAARAIFGVFFLTSLFDKILSFAKKNGYTENYTSHLLLVGFIIGNILSRLPEPFGLISVFSFVFIIQPFEALNFALLTSSDKYNVREQYSFNEKQIVLLIIGGILWILVLVGFLAGKQ